VPQTFELRATPPEALKAGGGPDELMIDWAGLPKGSTAQIYLPDVDASAIVATASQRDPAHGLELADGHTIGCGPRP
jgi:hypothetical protein